VLTTLAATASVGALQSSRDLALELTDCQIGLGTPALGVLNFLQVPLAGQKSAPYVAPGTSGKGSPFAVVRQRKI